MVIIRENRNKINFDKRSYAPYSQPKKEVVDLSQNPINLNQFKKQYNNLKVGVAQYWHCNGNSLAYMANVLMQIDGANLHLKNQNVDLMINTSSIKSIINTPFEQSQVKVWTKEGFCLELTI